MLHLFWLREKEVDTESRTELRRKGAKEKRRQKKYNRFIYSNKNQVGEYEEKLLLIHKIL